MDFSKCMFCGSNRHNHKFKYIYIYLGNHLDMPTIFTTCNCLFIACAVVVVGGCLTQRVMLHRPPQNNNNNTIKSSVGLNSGY